MTDKPTRILRVLVSLEQHRCGAPRAAARAAEAAAAAGVSCDLLAAEPHSPTIQSSLRVIPYPTVPSWWRARAPALPGLLADLVPSYDIVHIDEPWHYPHYAAARAAQRIGKPYVVTLHGELGAGKMRHKRIRKAIYWTLIQKDLLRRAAVIQAITTEEAERVRALGVDTAIAVIPNGVDPPRNRGVLPAGFPTGAVVLFVGQIHPVKGLDVLLAAFGRVRFPASLVVVGPDTLGLWARLQQRAEPGRVVYLGALEDRDLEAVYRRADLLVLPSRSEVLGLVTLEAMAHGVPVIVSPFCGFAEADLCGAGRVVDVEPAALARAMEDLLAEPGRRARMGEAGRRLTRDRYSWASVGRALVDLYAGVWEAK